VPSAALRYLQERYKQFLEGVVDEPVPEMESDDVMTNPNEPIEEEQVSDDIIPGHCCSRPL
jgi:hypothetical protein